MRALLLPLAIVSAVVQDGERADSYETRVRPLLVERCAECHGAEQQKAGLRLDTPGGLRAGSDVGAVLVAGEPDASRLIQAVRYTDPELSMPPKGKLAEHEVALLERWVAAGAPLPEGRAEVAQGEFDLARRARHWSFQPVTDPAPPAVRDERWCRSELDRFVRAALEERGLEPAPEASRNVWLRRVTVALTGVPPAPEELAAFLADGGQGAYERVVERLLASPRFGETWARHWLDLVRYSESKGHEFDYRIPNAWEYRDYVIRALNADVPYDQLLREHVAGDLLVTPRLRADGADESVLGTGFWTFGEELHSPVDIRRDETDRLANQIDVLTKGFQGLTVACARCHDHKFDAVRQRDYYALAGFPLSSSYRQVRFETARANARLARELRSLRARHADGVRAGLAVALERALEGAENGLAAARDVLAGPAPDFVVPAPPAGVDLVVADFEGETWEGWTAEGDAFGAGPVHQDDVPGHQGRLLQRGTRLVNSHAAHRSDEPTGTLTSAPFRLERDHLHFLIGGGKHAETALQLLLDGEVVRTQSGFDANPLRAAQWDVSELCGRDVQLRVVDGRSGGWGNIGVDHIVQSDAGSAAQLDEEPFCARRAWQLAVAERRGLAPAELERWRALALDLASWQALPGDAAPEGVVRADYRAPGTPWIEDGHAFRGGPLEQDALALSATAAAPARLSPGGAVVDPTWDGLRLAPGTQLEASQVDWVQAGRTLVTPTFTLESGVLWYEVRGRARVFAVVDSHRMLNGPLHGRTKLRIDTGGRWQWVRHDLSRYAGHRAHVELTPDAGQAAPFVVRRVVEGGAAPPEPSALGLPSAPEGWDDATIAALAGRLREGAAWLARAAPLSRADAGLLDGLLGALGEPVPELRAWVDAELALVEDVRWESRTAPALLDGSGVDELLLARGNAHTPLGPAPRGYLEALGIDVEVGGGSGRLALAEALVDPRNPFTARVAVNRLWHHMFGRGIVPTVDDFGVLGAAPSDLALLDELASDFARDWSIKRALRRMALSSTYRQSSHASARALERDPENALLHHVPVRRMTAEALRDSILFVSGTLDETRFGPPVALHLTPFMEGRGRPASGPPDGAGRRSIYLSVPRNFLSPLLLAFDFPAPASTMGRRTTSNVPAQALALLNDPFVVEEARRWARRSLAGELSPAARVRALYLAAFTREPSAAESDAALAFLGARPDEEAWADLCHVLLNVKEFRFLE
jgi:cytochrome c553